MQHLHLEQDNGFQKIEWRVQRFGWIAWGLIVLAASMGLLGSGWLSDRNRSAPDSSLGVKFDRFVHYHHPVQIELSLRTAPTDGEWQVTMDRSLLDRLQILRIEPEPERRVIADNAVTYSFLAGANVALGKVVFHVEYERYGGAQGRVSVAERSPVIVNQFVYP
jgi:hypothetical protein